MLLIKLTIEDAMAFYNHGLGDYTFNANYTQTNDWFFEIPDGWLDNNGQLSAERLEHIFRWMYGATWRFGNDDGSKYIVVRHQIEAIDLKTFSAATQRQRLEPSGTVTKLG